MTSPPIPGAEEEEEADAYAAAQHPSCKPKGSGSAIYQQSKRDWLAGLSKGRQLERQSLLDSGWTATVLEEMRGELRIQDEANEILTRDISALEADRDKYKEAVNSADALLCDALIDTDWDKVGEACSLLCVALAPRAGGTG